MRWSWRRQFCSFCCQCRCRTRSEGQFNAFSFHCFFAFSLITLKTRFLQVERKADAPAPARRASGGFRGAAADVGELEGLMETGSDNDRHLAEAMRQKLAGLRAYMHKADGIAPYKTLTHFLLHAFTLVAPPISDDILQLLLYIIHHPEFRVEDVPTSVYQLRSLHKLLPIVEPGIVLCLPVVYTLFPRTLLCFRYSNQANTRGAHSCKASSPSIIANDQIVGRLRFSARQIGAVVQQS
jgi:hypothetical protein